MLRVGTGLVEGKECKDNLWDMLGGGGGGGGGVVVVRTLLKKTVSCYQNTCSRPSQMYVRRQIFLVSLSVA